MSETKLSVAFIMPDMEIGGSQKSLIALLNALKDTNMNITLLLFEKKGSLLSSIPSWVKIEELPNAGGLENFRKKVSGLLMKMGAKRLFCVLKRFYHKFGSSLEHEKNQKEMFFYDVAVAYNDGVTTWYTAKNISAKVKIAFVHTDFEKAGYDAVSESKIYHKFQRIYCVSSNSKNSFVRMMPQLEDKIKVMENLVNAKELKELSYKGETFSDGFKGTRILTVGRLSREKGLDKAVQVLSMLKADEYQVRWYVIGEGEQRHYLQKLAQKLRVDHDFILLGQKKNPYGYMKDCDIYVQTSNYEGYCITLAEAGILAKPIISCDFPGARQRLTDGETGIIAGMTADSLYFAIKKMICDETLRKKYTENLSKIKMDSGSKVSDFCADISYLVSQ